MCFLIWRAELGAGGLDRKLCARSELDNAITTTAVVCVFACSPSYILVLYIVHRDLSWTHFWTPCFHQGEACNYSLGDGKCGPLHAHHLSCFAYSDILFYMRAVNINLWMKRASEYADEHFFWDQVSKCWQKNPLTAKLKLFIKGVIKSFGEDLN